MGVPALSIRQPYVEEILRGEKRFEYRSSPARRHCGQRVYLYASAKPGDENRFRKLGKEPGELPTGLIVGTVVIEKCDQLSDGTWRWRLSKPMRLKRPLKPAKRAQPVWFNPF